MSGQQLDHRFWSKVDIRTDNECWNWKAGLDRRRIYGRFRIGPKTLNAHRVAYALTYGEIGEGNLILHKCDNGTCCNPNHLYEGNQCDNMNDMVNRGRMRGGRKPGKKLPWLCKTTARPH